jgi:hypothetical protein
MIRTPPTLSTGRLDAMPWTHCSGPFRALDHTFIVRTTEAALGDYLRTVLDPFARADAGAGAGGRIASYSVVDRGDGTRNRYALYFERERLALTASGSFVVAMLLWHVNRRAIESAQDFVLVHAGAVEWDGQAALFPAPMDSGKTTLVAGLVRAGARYLSDEAAAIDPRTLLVHPFPKALTVGAGSRDVLADLRPADAPEFAARDRLADWHVDVRTIRADALAPPSRPGFVIALRYEAGAPTALSPMTRAEAVMEMGQNSFNLAHHGRAGVEALAAVARASECRRLVVGALDAACALIDDLRAGRLPGTDRA